MKKMTKFEKLGLEKKLLDTLDEAGFTTPFPIQERTIPVLLEGSDVIGQAHTGTGKTAAYALPMLQKITAKQGIQGIVMAPSTLPCGHTVCSSCITKLDMKACNTCRRPIGLNYKAKVNVTLRGIVCKYYPNELEACRMRLQANDLLKDGKRDLALEKYIEAVKLGKF